MLLHVDTGDRQAEGMAALLKRVMAQTGMTQSEIAERSEIPLATVNAWITGRRSPGKGPKAATMLRRLADVLPGVTVKDVFEAAGRTVPGPVTPEGQQLILDLYRTLSPGRQKLAEQMLRALAAEERPGA